MPRFHITQRRDAYQLYHARVEAESREEAHAMAEHDRLDWEEGDVLTFDDRDFDIEEVTSEDLPD